MTETTLHYDIVIIGSGAGGGTVAKELSVLCQRGYKIALLEWGGSFDKKDNTRDELTMAGRYYFDYGGFQTRQQDMTLAFARAVGGSTTVYTGTSLPASQQVFERWGVEGINLTDLKPRYDKYIKENNVHLNKTDELNDNNRLFYEGCKRLNWKVEQFPVNTRNCVGLSTCNLGCSVHAKQGTAIVQIPAAEKNGVDVVSFCRVDRVEGHDVVAEVLPAKHELKPSAWAPGHYRIKAEKVVFSAGAVYSPALLLRSIDKNRLPALGRYFTCHPALILVAQHDRQLNVTTGHPKSFYCSEFYASERFLLESCFYFPFTLAKNLSGFGAEVDELVAHYNQLQMILVLAIDEAKERNGVSLDSKGRPQVSYYFADQTIDSFVAAIRASTRIFFAAGAKKVHAPAMKKFFICAEESGQIDSLIEKKHFKLGKISIAAAHLMGGCRMGDDIKTSVTDAWGRVHGFDDYYVADGSLFPQASEVNPYLTIMALADRVAQGIKRDLGEKE